MRQFLIHVGKLIVILIIIMYGLDAIYSHTFRKGIPRNKIQKILQLNNQHFDYVFLGSSRTENHIDCELIEKLTGKSCMNFGISGGTIGDMLVLMTLANSRNITFNEVFLQVDYSYNTSGISSNFKASLVPYMNNNVVKKQLSKDGENFYYNHIPFYRYLKYDKVVGFREFCAVLLNKQPRTDLNVGFAPKIGNGMGVSGKLPIKYKETNEELKELVKLLNNNDVELSCFTAPFCENIENRKFANNLETRVPNFKNYISIFDENPEYFFNCGHLNIEGARAFTKILIEDMIKSTKSSL